MYADPSGNFPFFILTMLIGAFVYGAYRGINAHNNGAEGWEIVGECVLGAVIGGAVGAAVGLATGVLLAAKATASIGAVWSGAKALAWAYTMGGPGAALGFMANNVTQWVHHGNSLAGYYPPDGGFMSKETTILQQGQLIQRFGPETGKFVAPYFSDPFSLSLPYDKMSQMFDPNVYIVNQPIEVLAGQAAPWFGQYGGGLQYLLPEIIQKLIEQGIISKF